MKPESLFAENLDDSVLSDRPRTSTAVTDATLIVVPTFNERENLPTLLDQLFGAAPEAHALVVDDASPDGTAELCREIMGDRPGLHLLERSGPRALGRAYVAGLQYGLEHGYTFVGTMDADLSHAPRYLADLHQSLVDGADVAIGSRYVRDGGTLNWGLRRMVLSRAANRFSALLLNIPAHDVTSGYRLYRSSLLRRVDLRGIRSTGYSFLVELLYRAHQAGARISEAPIIFHDRRMGRSKLRSREIYFGALRLLGLRLTGDGRSDAPEP